MKKPKHTTSTGALPNSAGFPGRNMVVKPKGKITFFPAHPEKVYTVEIGEPRTNNDHKYWQ